MGIIVTVFMLLILLLSVPNPLGKKLQKYQGQIALWAFLAACWNVFWYGLQHMGEFWGTMALVSGLLLLFCSLPLLSLASWPAWLKRPMQRLQQKQASLPRRTNSIALIALALCAARYAYTLIQLNING